VRPTLSCGSPLWLSPCMRIPFVRVQSRSALLVTLEHSDDGEVHTRSKLHVESSHVLERGKRYCVLKSTLCIGRYPCTDFPCNGQKRDRSHTRRKVCISSVLCGTLKDQTKRDNSELNVHDLRTFCRKRVKKASRKAHFFAIVAKPKFACFCTLFYRGRPVVEVVVLVCG
jgi:hypothetical protein